MISNKEEIKLIKNIKDGIDAENSYLKLGFKNNNFFSSKEYTKEYVNIKKIVLAPIFYYHSLLIGIILEDIKCNKYTFAFVRDKFLQKAIFSIAKSDEVFSTEWIIKDLLQKNLKRGHALEEYISNTAFTESPIGSSMYIQNIIYQSGSLNNKLQTTEEFAIDELGNYSMLKIPKKDILTFEVEKTKKKESR